jgi:plasmid maintenance system antidote protein VapI
VKVTPETKRRLVQFGKSVERAMDRRGVTVREASRVTKIHRRNLQRILCGQNVSMDMMVRLRRLLRVRLVVDFT